MHWPKIHRSRSSRLDQSPTPHSYSTIGRVPLAIGGVESPSIASLLVLIVHTLAKRPNFLSTPIINDVKPPKINDRPGPASQRLLFPAHLVLLGRPCDLCGCLPVQWPGLGIRRFASNYHRGMVNPRGDARCHNGN